jgi:hypothetical protein
MKQQTQMYAILRFDELAESTEPIENRVTVTKLMQEQSAADSEVSRLNKLNGSKGAKYFWQTVRLET